MVLPYVSHEQNLSQNVCCADSDVQFLHGMLEGMANIEARAYGLLRELGAAPLTKVIVNTDDLCNICHEHFLHAAAYTLHTGV